MINKKLLAVASIVAVVSSSSAFAKTEGNYVGLNAVRSHAKNQYTVSGADSGSDFKDNAVGFGADYKYAFNMNDFFIAPGAFIERNGTKAKDVDGDNVNIEYRYGLKADIGYDVNDSLSVYFTNGISNNAYKVDWRSVGTKKTGTEIGYFYGLGVAYNVTKDIAMNIEYNMQSIELDTPVSATKVENDLSVVKLGVSYHF